MAGLLVATVPLMGGTRLLLGEPCGAWVAVLVAGLMLVFMVASSIPWRHRDLRPPE